MACQKWPVERPAAMETWVTTGWQSPAASHEATQGHSSFPFPPGSLGCCTEVLRPHLLSLLLVNEEGGDSGTGDIPFV